MILFGKQLSKSYGCEVALFHKNRAISDGLTVFEGKLNWDRFEGDHAPRLEFHFIVFNYTIVEASLYYLHHRR